MMLTGLSFTILTGVLFAAISMIISRVARERISFFQFFTLSNLIAAAGAWILMVNWSMVFSGVNWGKILLITGSVGFVNVGSQAAFVTSLKWGHNGLSVAIRNSASMISMIFGLVFLHESISLINASGVLLVILSLAVIAIFSGKKSLTPDLRKWIPAVTCSLLLSGAYQILLTSTVTLPETDRQAGVIIPCLMSFSCIGNLVASIIQNQLRRIKRPFYRFKPLVWKVLFCWSAAALLHYILLINALENMRKAGMAAVTWPVLIGVNVTVFSVFCRLKWKEKYPPTTVIGMIGCVLGLIMIIWGRK